MRGCTTGALIVRTCIAIFVLYFSFSASSATSDTLSPCLISTGGGFVTSNGMSFSFSIGEPMIATLADSAHRNMLTQGFQQPSDSTKAGKVPFFYTGFSPDNDGKNDTWIIDYLENYPDNTVTIFNRWGKKVWFGKGYNNGNSVDKDAIVWDGKDLSSNVLPLGTYFYIVSLDGKKDYSKGWVEITKK